MFASQREGSAAYRRVGAETGVVDASSHRLILMLFEGTLAAIAQARISILAGAVQPKTEAISKAILIIDEGLSASLDLVQGGAIADSLKRLYEYLILRLMHANIRNETEPLDEVARLLGELKQAWAAIAADPAASDTANRP